MSRTGNRSIVDQIRMTILKTAIVAVLISGAFVMTSEYFLFRDNYLANITSVVDVVSYNVMAPLVFDDANDARQMLQSLEQIEGVMAALVLDETGALFASFNQAASDELLQTLQASHTADKRHVQIIEGRLLHINPIRFDGGIVGYLVISASLDDINMRLAFQSLMLVLVLLTGAAVAYLTGSRMQRVITQPIEQLSSAMARVSESQDYAIRIPKRNNDEIGVLIDGFNGMVEQIHERDLRLEAANDALEETVHRRTEQLESTNLALNSTLAEAREARAKAEAANRVKGAFLATMSHEIRTPINGFLGNTELLLNEDIPDSARKYGEIAYRSGEALLDIINDILDFSKIEAGKLEFSENAFSLSQVIEELCVSLRPVIRGKQLDLDLQLAGAPANLIVGDQGRVRQVISNLITNAMKFTSKGTITVRVSHREIENDCVLVRVSVQDTGIGIPADSVNSVFDRFEQVDNSFERAVGGTGLGLTICRELVQHMGGDIGVESDAGEGSLFWFEVPFSQSGQSAHGFSGGRTDQIVLGEAEDPCRALVVDDSEINRDMAYNMLIKLGAEVEIAFDGREAIERAATNTYDLILMDCQMPEIDGFRATRRIRSMEEEAKRRPAFIVALTANAIKGDRERCLQAGMSDYLAKPFKMEELRCQVAAALDFRRVHEANQMLIVDETLDQTVLNNIRQLESDGSSGLLSRYVEIYLRTVPGLLDAIKLGVEQTDSEALTFAAHSLKSESAPLGASQMANLARQLEESGRAGRFDGTHELITAAREEFQLVEQALLQEVAAA